MSLTREELIKVAKLSRLEFKEEELDIINEQLNDIFTYIEELQGVDTEGVEPLISVNDPMGNLREDRERESVSTKDSVKNAKKSHEGAVVVPKVVGGN